MSISVSLDTALRALLAQQAAVDTTSHNVSNVSTPGYSRQRVRMISIPGNSHAEAFPRPGQGVDVVGIDRVRDLFMDIQVRTANQELGRQSARAASLERAESALGEPGDAGLRAALSQFFNNWRDLSNAPDSSTTRTAVVQSAQTLAGTVQRIRGSLVALRDEANRRVAADVKEINGLTKEIATLNAQIASVSSTGIGAGDLRDQRDLDLDRLSQLVNATITLRDDGIVDIALNGRSVVRGTIAYDLGLAPDILNNNYYDVTFAADGTVVNVGNGEIRGLLDQRDTDLPARIADLDTLVGQMITDVNTAHAAGYGLDGVTGRDFFAGTDAASIAVDPAVLADLNAVAAAQNFDLLTGTPRGDGSNAAAISDLQYARNLVGGTATYDAFYEGFVSSLGASTREAERQQDAQSLVLDHMEQVRQGASGVKLDEEMVSLMRYQRAYQAAAHLLTVADNLLDHLINRTA